MKFFLPIHSDGGNRGCEAITKGTALILGAKKEDMQALCRNIELDSRLGVDKLATLVPFPVPRLWRRAYRKLFSFVPGMKQRMQNVAFSNVYDPFLKKLTLQDVMLSTGGDMMCYSNNQVIYTNNWLHSRGIKTVLWGCSIGKANLTPEKIETLHNFSLIYARESLTADMLKKLGLKNVITFPDPAFILQPDPYQLPSVFDKEVIGINLSNYVVGSDGLDTPFGAEVILLMEYLLNATNFNILLLPHVMWKGQDDRLIANAVMRNFQFHSRIYMLDSDSLNYCQLRYVISRCRYFIGARTHAVISAYSTCVPTIALGYSVKSQGIAKDLNLPDELLVDCKQFKSGTLVASFRYLQSAEMNIRKHLEGIVPAYVKRLTKVKAIVFDMLSLENE